MKIENIFENYIKLRSKLNEGKIYQIVDNTNNNVYIGSTCCSLKNRLSEHKSKYKRFLKGLCNNVKSFDIIKNGDYKIELLEDCNIKTKQELLARERYFIKNNNCLNKYIPGSCDNGIQQYQKEYYETNKEKFTDYNKDYYIDNKDKAKAYYEANKDKLKEKFECDCGGHYTNINKLKHQKTSKHIKYL